MTDYPKALAALREARTKFNAEVARVAGPQTLQHRAEELSARVLDFLDALDAQVPVAWRMFDGEGGYDFRDELPSENSRAWSARYGRKWEPLYAAPPAAADDCACESVLCMNECECAVRGKAQSDAAVGAKPVAWVHTWEYPGADSLTESFSWKPADEFLRDTVPAPSSIVSSVPLYAAPPAPAVPAGYALVPVEPTEVMLDAGHAAAWRRIPSCFDMTDAEIVYRAMLAAALAERKEISRG